jgi:hypothetical protein
VCYRLHLATPLTLSEVRSMLPAGVVAHAAAYGEQALMRDHLPNAQLIVELRRGACGCDFVIQRDPAGRTDETHLRERGIRAGIPRAQLAAMLAAHRQPMTRVQPVAHWQGALAGFVAEHARNAGPALFHRSFTAGSRSRRVAGAGADAEPTRVTVSRVREAPGEWLAEDRITLVVRD